MTIDIIAKTSVSIDTTQQTLIKLVDNKSKRVRDASTHS